MVERPAPKFNSAAKPDTGAVCFVTPLGEDASNAAVRMGLDPSRTVAVDMSGRFSGRRTLMKTPVTRPNTRRSGCGAVGGRRAGDGDQR